MVDERTGDGDPLLLTARHLRQDVVQPLSQADPLQDPRPPGGSLRWEGGRRGVVERHDDVADRRRPRQKVEALEHEAELRRPDEGPLVRREVADLLAVEPVPSEVGRSRQPRMFMSVLFPEPEAPIEGHASRRGGP